jgi:60 kDa SS-A/Ro ribonucleoprotein
MARLNVRNETEKQYTHEGARAYDHLTAEQKLRRSVMSCFLWENEFYEDGVSIADRIVENARLIPAEKLAQLAVEIRTQANLRHVPLLLLDVLSERAKENPGLVSKTIEQVISRPDELAEFLAVYWRNGRKTVSHQIRKGLAAAFGKFNEYSLAKYDRDGAIKLRDVMRIVHPKPKDEVQSALFKKVLDRTLTTPDTWEVALSGGADKKETFERLLKEGKLGYFALLRNLRNMIQAGVDRDLVNEAILARKNGAEKVLPFRYVAAAKYAPLYEPSLDQALIASVDQIKKFKGRTGILVDVSGSMNHQLSAKSELTRMDAAAALAAIFPADLKDLEIVTFSYQNVDVPARRGMAGIESIRNSQVHGGTMLGNAVNYMNRRNLDRLIVITDEQSHERVEAPNTKRAYMINVASNRNGVGYGNGWVHIDGFSERIFDYIHEYENSVD